MKIQRNFSNSFIALLSTMLIILGLVPDLALALDGQNWDDLNQTNGTLHSDIRIENIYTDPKVPKPSSFATICAIVKNKGDATSDPTSVIYSINESEAREDVRSLEPGEELPVYHIWETPDQEGTVLIKASLDNVNNSQKEISIAIAENPLPDLVIESIVTDPSEPIEGKPLNFTVKVKNQGLIDSGEALAKYYINGTPGQDISIPALPDGDSADLMFSLPPDQVKGGPMEVKVVIDTENSVIESNETNNEFGTTVNVKILLPDLIIKSLPFSPKTPKTGENITFTAYVTNNGTGVSPTSALKYTINENNNTYSKLISIPSLAAGETKKITFNWVPTYEGNIEVTAQIDPDNVVSEIYETNNQRKINVAVIKESNSTGDGGGNNSSSGSNDSGSGSNISGSGESGSGESGSGSSESGSGSSSESGSSSGSSSYSSGGGIGYIFSQEPAINVVSRELTAENVVSGQHIRYNFSRNSTCIIYIEYDAERTFLRTTTIVEELKNKSIYVPAFPPGRIYKYVNICVGNKVEGLPTSLKDGLIGFRVEKAWINENNVDESYIALQRYNRSWEPLYTEKVSEDNNYVYFKSKTPGFSSFTITENTEKISKSGNSGVQIEANLQHTPVSPESTGNEVKGRNGNNIKPNGAMEVAKIVMMFSLPLFLILVGYLVVKRKI